MPHPGGRPRLDQAMQRRVTLTVPEEYLAWMRDSGGGNASEGLRRLLEELDQRQGAEAQAERDRVAGAIAAAAPPPTRGRTGSRSSRTGS